MVLLEIQRSLVVELKSVSLKLWSVELVILIASFHSCQFIRTFSRCVLRLYNVHGIPLILPFNSNNMWSSHIVNKQIPYNKIQPLKYVPFPKA